MTGFEDQELFERTHRPTSLDEFVGQASVRHNLKTAITAAKLRGEPLEHILFCGPPGLGKTTLANIVAAELGVPIQRTSGPVLEKPKDLAMMLMRLPAGAVFFIDEIHRMNVAVEEILYPAIEDFEIDIVIGEGPGARSVKMALKPFTLIGATTRTSLLSRPLLDRFGLIEQLDYYEEDELTEVVQRHATKIGLVLDPEAAREIARRARGTPRVALGHLRRVRDAAAVEGVDRVDVELARRALAALGVDELGLQRLHRRYLEVLVVNYEGGPVGIATLAAAVGEDRRTLEEVVEPYLIRKGLIAKTARGRTATVHAWRHLGREPDGTGRQPGLF